MTKTRIIVSSIGGFILLLMLIVILGFFELGMFKTFRPRRENIKREVFEETKSYVHAKIQDLAKYRHEYNTSQSFEDKAAIASMIRMQFAEFNEKQIQSTELQRFLIKIRGY